METGDYAWLALAVGVLVYDVRCEKGQMLSERSAVYAVRHRVLWTTTVVYFAGHLLHVWPYDPLARLAKALGR